MAHRPARLRNPADRPDFFLVATVPVPALAQGSYCDCTLTATGEVTVAVRETSQRNLSPGNQSTAFALDIRPDDPGCLANCLTTAWNGAGALGSQPPGSWAHNPRCFGNYWDHHDPDAYQGDPPEAVNPCDIRGTVGEIVTGGHRGGCVSDGPKLSIRPN